MDTAATTDPHGVVLETLRDSLAPMCGSASLPELAAHAIEALLEATGLDSGALIVTGATPGTDGVCWERGFTAGFCQSLVERSVPWNRLLRTTEAVFLERNQLRTVAPDSRGRRLQLLGAFPIFEQPKSGANPQLACVLLGSHDQSLPINAALTDLLGSAVAQLSGSLRCRLRTQRERELLEADIAQVFAHLTCGLLVTRLAEDSSDPRGGTVALANPVALDILGMPHYAVGTPVRRWVKEADVLLGRGEQTCRHTLEVATPAGKRILGFSNVRARLPLGPAVITLFQDIGKTQGIEERRRHSEQLAHVGEMAARLSHDLSNPLASLRAGLEFLARAAKLEPKHLQMVDVLFNEIDKMSTLSRSLLDATKPAEITTVPQPLLELVRGSLSVYQNLATKRGVELQLNADVADDAAVTVDRNVFMRVVSNLVINAIEAMDDAGCVSVTCRLLSEEQTKAQFGDFPTSVFAIEITDDGPGIPADKLKSVFKPFYTTKDHGTGLGLAMAQDTIDQYGGIISVASEAGRGTTFSIFLPSSSPSPCWVLARQNKTSCSRNCGLCTMRESGGYLCWSHLGRAEYMETGQWHRPCQQCKVYLASNLTPWVNK